MGKRRFRPLDRNEGQSFQGQRAVLCAVCPACFTSPARPGEGVTLTPTEVPPGSHWPASPAWMITPVWGPQVMQLRGGQREGLRATPWQDDGHCQPSPRETWGSPHPAHCQAELGNNELSERLSSRE